jgi:hypothetical protein
MVGQRSTRKGFISPEVVAFPGGMMALLAFGAGKYCGYHDI